MKTLAAIAVMLLGATAAHAIEAERLAPGETIALDGRLDEPAWTRAKPWDRFYELAPDEKVEAKVRTEARFAFDSRALYVAVRAYDPDMAQLRAPFARRDSVLSDQDMVVLFIDPVGKRKFAHFVRANPRGVIADGLYNEDTGNEDFSPDFDVEVATGRFEGGWTAEFRIPFSSLRYSDPPSKEWSVLVFRNWPREQRYRMASSPLPRDTTCFLCLNEPLTGLGDLPPTRSLTLTPNVTLRSVEARDIGVASHREQDFVASVDAKWRPSADLVVDATINPDFSQVELDTPQLAGNAQFALYYPEKRPFFLEGSDILQGPFNAIYTRSVTDPAWGVRATERRGDFDGTVLVTRDEGGGLVILPNTYTTNYALQGFKSTASFARARWQVGGASAGALFTDRTLDGGAYNRVAGPDVAWFPTTEHRLRAQVLGSWTTAFPTASGDTLVKGALQSSHAALADWAYNGPNWIEYLKIEDVGRQFRADNGFFGQNGYRTIYNETTRKFLNVWGLNEVSPYFNAEHKTTPGGSVQYQQTYFGIRWGLPRATTIATEYRPNGLVAVREGGGIRKRDQFYLSIESNPFPWFSRLFAETAFGDRIDIANNRVGRGVYYSIQANVRPHQRMEVEYRIDDDFIDRIEPVEGSKRILTQRVQQLLAIWHFSAKDSVRGIYQSVALRRSPSQYEVPVPAHDSSETISLVYGHRHAIGTSFYVGATFSRNRDADLALKHLQTELFAKASWAFEAL